MDNDLIEFYEILINNLEKNQDYYRDINKNEKISLEEKYKENK